MKNDNLSIARAAGRAGFTTIALQIVSRRLAGADVRFDRRRT
jgi:hypothetical protein